MTFQKILFPLAFDDNSLAALDLAADLARQEGGTICLLHVVPPPMGTAEISAVPLEPYPAELEDSKRRIEQLGRQRLEGKVPYETDTRIGDPALEIVKAATDFGADLVVMATHGRKGVSHFFLGSVAERVVRRSPVPVLTIRPGKAAAAATGHPAPQSGKKLSP